jgi:hypothetical protein
MSEDLQAVVARLEKVERQNSLMKIAGLVLLTLSAAAVLMGQAAPESKIIEAERLVVRNVEGDQSAILGKDDKGRLGLHLYGAGGKMRSSLFLRSYGHAELVFSDRDGDSMAWFSSQAGLSLYDENNVRRVSIGTFMAGCPSLHLNGEDGRARAIIGCYKEVIDSEGPDESGILKIHSKDIPVSSLALFDEEVNVIWSAP